MDDNELPREGRDCCGAAKYHAWILAEAGIERQSAAGRLMYSGDGGYMDERAFVFIVVRMKNTVISGGENIHSAEVEDGIFYQHDAIVEQAVIGVPDERWGEVFMRWCACTTIWKPAPRRTSPIATN